MPYYKDLREYLKILEARGRLVRIKREINKDTELMPLVRLQFRGLPEEERKAFIFENIIDSKQRKYKIPIAVSVLAANREMYAIGMNCDPDNIADRWAQAQLNPIQPEIVGKGFVHDEIHMSDSLLEHGGLAEFPVPISLPGYDAGPFMSSPYWVTKDPETGIPNIGTYRVHVKSPTRTGVMFGNKKQHMAIHVAKCRKMGKQLEGAIVIGGPPSMGYVSVTRLPYEVNEFAFVGGIAGEPLELVKCKTVDLEVPAYAEVVIEGIVSTDEVEPEAPFGEALGYMGVRENMPHFRVTCITHRKNPIFQVFLSQFPPSESSKIRGIGREGAVYKFLKHDCNQSWISEVAMHESTGSAGLMVIKTAKADQTEIWKTLDEASKWAGDNSPNTKFILAVDNDIDTRDADALLWAASFRMVPHRDCRIDTAQVSSPLDHSLSPPDETIKKDVRYEDMPTTSRLLMNATMKWPYPPVSLPKREFMEQALKIWKAENLPPLKLKEPWWGRNLGYWLPEFEEHAMMAVKGDYEAVGEILAQQRRKI